MDFFDVCFLVFIIVYRMLYIVVVVFSVSLVFRSLYFSYFEFLDVGIKEVFFYGMVFDWRVFFAWKIFLYFFICVFYFLLLG